MPEDYESQCEHVFSKVVSDKFIEVGIFRTETKCDHCEARLIRYYELYDEYIEYPATNTNTE